MNEDLVMRTVVLPQSIEAVLRQFSGDAGCTFNELVRIAVAEKVSEWLADEASLERDLQYSKKI